MFRKHRTSASHLAVLVSAYLWQKGIQEFPNLKYCSLPTGLPCWKPQPHLLFMPCHWRVKYEAS